MDKIKILYKKCAKGHINKYGLNEEEVKICKVCQLPLGIEEYVFDDEVSEEAPKSDIDKKAEISGNCDYSRYKLVDTKNRFEISIPDVNEPIVLGRQGLGSDRKIWGPNISRKHLLITAKASGIFIEECGSTNGTLLDNKKIEKNEKIMMFPGQILVLDAIDKSFELVLVKNER